MNVLNWIRNAVTFLMNGLAGNVTPVDPTIAGGPPPAPIEPLTKADLGWDQMPTKPTTPTKPSN